MRAFISHQATRDPSCLVWILMLGIFSTPPAYSAQILFKRDESDAVRTAQSATVQDQGLFRPSGAGRVEAQSGANSKGTGKGTSSNTKPPAGHRNPGVRSKYSSQKGVARNQSNSGGSPSLSVQLSNLPAEYQALTRSNLHTDGPHSIVPKDRMGVKLAGVSAGDSIPAILEQSIKQSSTVPTDVRARVTSGPLEGAIFLGEASLDRELKRVLIDFTEIRLPGRDISYLTKGRAHSTIGQVGLEGDYHEEGAGYAIAAAGATAAAIAADAFVQRPENAFGTIQTEPSVGNIAKQSFATYGLERAKQWSQQAQTAPGYTEIQAGQRIQIILKQDPVEKHSQT